MCPICAMGELQTHIVDLSKLEIGTYRLDYQLDTNYFSAIEKTELLGGNVEAHAVLNLRAEDFDLKVSVKGIVQVVCDRCLDPMDLPVEAEDEMEVEEGAKVIDLDWLAYELIVVNLPLVHSHQPGGCNPKMDALLQDHLCTGIEEGNDSDDSM